MAVKIVIGDKEYIIGKEYEFSDSLQKDKGYVVKWHTGILKGYCPHPYSANSFVCGSQYYVHCREKVEELDYEILSVISNDKIVISKSGYTYPECFQTLVDQKDDFDIHSVKRLSDGEVFTIGDEVLYKGNKITKIFINTLKTDLKGIWVTHNNGNTHLETVPKLKTPLLITEDGVDIFKGNEYYFIFPDFHIAFEPKANAILIGALGTFSTKEKAEEYVLLNKPCLSIQDIKKAISKDSCFYMTHLKSLVRSKL